MRMLATGAAVFLLSTFAVAGAPEPIQGSFAVNADIVPHEIRLGKDSYDQKARRIIPSPVLFANAQLQGASLSTDGTGVGGSTPEILLMSAQETSLIGYQEPPQGIIPPRESSTEEPEEGGIRTHIVAEGETLSTIAQKYGIDVNTILWSNDVGSADLIGVGDKLVILPTSGVMHEVSDGETLSAIATRYKVEVDAITKANGISSNTIFAGQKLVVPGASPEVRPATNRPNLAANPKGSTRSVSGYFTRPTSGYLSQGLHPTNAVDIAGSCWSPVYAAAGGTIALATGGGGWNGGYGNYVAIDHANGTRTLYAHLIQVNTSAGKYVNQGGVIGYMGSTGRSTGCHLHFEVRGASNPIR